MKKKKLDIDATVNMNVKVPLWFRQACRNVSIRRTLKMDIQSPINKMVMNAVLSVEGEVAAEGRKLREAAKKLESQQEESKS